MHDLVRLAERRERACREEMSRLLASRSTMLESAAAAAAAESVAAADAVDGQADKAAAGHSFNTVAAADNEPDMQTVTQKIEVAEKEMEEAQVTTNNPDVCMEWHVELACRETCL